MAIRKVALIFDDKIRPDTTGVYCRTALAGLADVRHFQPTELDRINFLELRLSAGKVVGIVASQSTTY